MKKDQHHTIPMTILLIPGAIMVISFFLFISELKDWAYLVMGMAITVTILIHREEE